MCGIICLLQRDKSVDVDTAHKCLSYLSDRGPDKSADKILLDGHLYMGFTRLAIMDLTDAGLQPFEDENGIIICNGEIYNYRFLAEKYGIDLKTSCDCEVLLPLCHKIGFYSMIKDELNGEFAMVYYDKKAKKIYAARDRYGVRPLYYGHNDTGFGFASELKALNPVMTFIEQHPPPYIYEIDVEDAGRHPDKVTPTNYFPDRIQYHFYEDIRTDCEQNLDTVRERINFLLTQAVTRKLGAHRKMGFLLSGGLDSSLIVAIATKILGQENMVCFSVGVDGSPDVEASKEVVKYLGIKHHHIIPFNLEEGFDLLSDIIRDVETYDVTTVRASAPQYIMAKYIRDNTDVRVILSGEGSDEIHGSYRYFRDAPTLDDFHRERIRLVSELHWFDNKRTDRTMAHHGLEVRVPFLDFDYVDYVLKMDPKLFTHSRDHMEKILLRDSFKGYLPNSILYRSKEAFSDAVSSNELNWKSYIEMRLEDSIELFDHEFTHDNSLTDKPKTKTGLYFLRLFSRHYPRRFNVLPHQWMPKFQTEDVIDPSATVLKSY